MNKEQQLLLKLNSFGASETQKELWLNEYAKEYHEAEVIKTWKEQTTWQLRTAEREMTQDKRERIFASALQGLLSNSLVGTSTPFDKIVDHAIEIADFATAKLCLQSIDNQNKEA